MLGGEAAWQELTDSREATCGLGFGWGWSQNQEAWHQNYVEGPPQMSHANAKMTQGLSSCPHPETAPFPPCQALFRVNTCDICGAEDYFGNTGLPQTTGWVTHVFFCLEVSGHGSGRTTFCAKSVSIIFLLWKHYLYTNTNKSSQWHHNVKTTVQGYDFSSYSPRRLFLECNVHFPLGDRTGQDGFT